MQPISLPLTFQGFQSENKFHKNYISYVDDQEVDIAVQPHIAYVQACLTLPKITTFTFTLTKIITFTFSSISILQSNLATHRLCAGLLKGQR